MMDAFFAEIAALFGSDVLSCPAMGQGFVQCYGANVLAHIAIAILSSMAVFLLGWSYRWLLVSFAFLIELQHGFQAKRVIKDSIRHYNIERPHTALDKRSPDDAFFDIQRTHKTA